MEQFKYFVDNTRLLGYKGKLPLLRDMIDENTAKKYENLFYGLNILYEDINALENQKIDNDLNKGKKKYTPLTKNELEIYNKYFTNDYQVNESEYSNINNNNISEFNENSQLLEIALDEINNDNYLLDLEEEKLKEEINLNEQLLSNELEEYNLLSKKNEIKNNNNNNMKGFYEYKINNYKTENIDKIKQETVLLNKTLSNIITELDLNIKKSNLLKENSTYIIGYRKINDTQFDETMKLLINNIYQFEANYDTIKRKIKMESVVGNKNNDIFKKYMEEINKTEQQMLKVMRTEFELVKNDILINMRKNKILYQNNILKEFISNPDSLDNYIQKYSKEMDTRPKLVKMNLNEKIKEVFEVQDTNVYNKYIDIKNNYIQKILDKYLNVKFNDQINFIKCMEKYEKILNAMYPYIINDERVIQLIYDSICEITEIYAGYQLKIGMKQSILRQKYSKIVEPINKITVDERDVVLLKLGDEILKEENLSKNDNKSVKIYEIQKVIDKLIFLFSHLKSSRYNKIIDSIYIDLTTHFKEFTEFLNVFLNKQDYLSEVRKYNREFKKYKGKLSNLIYVFNSNIDKIIVKKNTKSKSNLAFISIYDALFLYFFHRDLYNKEIGKDNFVFNLNNY